MKKIKPVVLAVVTGSLCAMFLFKEVADKNIVATSGNVVAIQLGVFKDKEEAKKMSNIHGGEVFVDKDLYRVYYSILNKGDNIDYITDYLSRNGISYYLKQLSIDDDVLAKTKDFEEKMKKTEGDKKLKINAELLELYKDVM